MSYKAVLRAQQGNSASHWCGVPTDVVKLVMGYVRAVPLAFTGQPITGVLTVPFQPRSWHANGRMFVSLEEAYLTVKDYSGRILHQHRMRQNIYGCKLSQKELIYFNHRWIYRWSLDFKHYQKKACDLGRLVGPLSSITSLAYCGWNVLVERRDPITHQIEVLYLTPNPSLPGGYGVQLIQSGSTWSVCYLTKRYAILAEETQLHVYFLATTPLRKITHSILLCGPIRNGLRVSKHHLAFISWPNCECHANIYDFLSSMMVSTMPITTIVRAHGRHHFYKEGGSWRLLVIADDHKYPANYQIFG